MTITCKEFTLKIISEKEYESLFYLIEKNRNRLLRYFPNTLAETKELNQTKQFLKNATEQHEAEKLYPFGIYVSGTLVGWISVKNLEWAIPKCEFGYYIDQAQKGKGIMTKVVHKMLTFCFEVLKIEKVFLRIGSDNLGSLRIAVKTGFKKEGVLRKEFRIDTNELIDVEYFGKLKNEQ